MRLFVAVHPSPDAVASLDARLAGVRPRLEPLRWVRPADWHVTLAFLGSVGDELRPELDERLSRAAARHEPFEVAFGSAGRFGERIAYARVEGERAGMIRLADRCSAAARRTGIEQEDRPYWPHLTLARAPRGMDLGPVIAALEGYAGPSWTVEAISLMESRPPTAPGEPPQYVEQAGWQLGRAG